MIEVDECEIEAMTEFRHGVGLVHIGTGEELRTHGTEDFLSGGENGAVLFAASGNVEQAK